MSDLIDRQAAIDALLHNQEVYSHNYGTDAIDKYTTAIIANDVETIAQLPSAQPEPKWIPVTERLPDSFGNYLVSIKRRNGPNCEEYVVNDIAFWNRSGGFHKADEVVAWMPLPQPYERSEDE